MPSPLVLRAVRSFFSEEESQTSVVPIYAKSAIHLQIGSMSIRGAAEHVRSDDGDLPLTQIERQSTSSRTELAEHITLSNLDAMRAIGLSASRSRHIRLAPWLRSLVMKPPETSRQFLTAAAKQIARSRRSHTEATSRDNKKLHTILPPAGSSAASQSEKQPSVAGDPCPGATRLNALGPFELRLIFGRRYE